MRKIEKFVPVLILLIITSSTIAGCIGSDDEDDVEEADYEFETLNVNLQGQLETLAQAAPVTVTEEFHYQIPGSQFTRMRINLSIEDGDENTGIDHIDNIRMWRETGEEPSDIQTATGGDTPYFTSIEFEYEGNERDADWWIVEITATCEAGEDTWIGPLIWQGIPDHGVFFTIGADYDCIIGDLQEDNEEW